MDLFSLPLVVFVFRVEIKFDLPPDDVASRFLKDSDDLACIPLAINKSLDLFTNIFGEITF